MSALRCNEDRCINQEIGADGLRYCLYDSETLGTLFRCSKSEDEKIYEVCYLVGDSKYYQSIRGVSSNDAEKKLKRDTPKAFVISIEEAA